ncbi:MAG: M23 family metallopeptidase [Gemmatimonadaceae bacterium]|nr:M23 family metallopeptidase [Gemmatimonadaceae bacterium]
MPLIGGACGGGLRPLPPARAPAPVPAGEAPTTVPTGSGRPLPDDESALRARGLMVPVDGVPPVRVPDTFTASRGERGIHGAVDILAPRGTLVVAADGGRVWKVRSNTLGGLTIYVIDDDSRFVYYYAHLDRYVDGLAEGQRVARGDPLGYVGTTGNAPENTPHLHFQMLRYRGNGRWWDGTPLDPRPFLTRPGEVNRR